MDQQTQRTVLLSLIVSLLTTVPLALLISLITVSYLSSEQQVNQPVQQTIQEALDASPQVSQVVEPVMKEVILSDEKLRPNQQTAQTEAGRLIIDQTIFTTDDAIYQFKSERIAGTNPVEIIQRIERTELSSGDTTVWVEDVKKEFQAEDLEGLEEFVIFSNPKEGEDLYLGVVISGTDRSGVSYYRFNINEKKLERLTVSAILAGSFGQYAISPDGLQVLYAPQNSQVGLDQDLILVNLEQDTVKTLFTLSGEETFNAGLNGLQFQTNLAWVDNENFTYDVYDQSLKPGNPDLSSEGIQKILIENRSYSLTTK